MSDFEKLTGRPRIWYEHGSDDAGKLREEVAFALNPRENSVRPEERFTRRVIFKPDGSAAQCTSNGTASSDLAPYLTLPYNEWDADALRQVVASRGCGIPDIVLTENDTFHNKLRELNPDMLLITVPGIYNDLSPEEIAGQIKAALIVPCPTVEVQSAINSRPFPPEQIAI